MLYGDIDLGQHWLRQWLVAWWHQAITWTNVDLWSVRSIGIHLRAILQKIPQPPIIKISLKITFLKFLSNLPGANKSTDWGDAYMHHRIVLFHKSQCALPYLDLMSKIQNISKSALSGHVTDRDGQWAQWWLASACQPCECAASYRMTQIWSGSAMVTHSTQATPPWQCDTTNA